MNAHYGVVIIGGGILGLATAYHLAEHGVTDVLVVDRAYLCSGASGRNGGGIRAQFATESNIRLMQQSIARCRAFAAKMRINVWFRQGGYLFLARSPERAAGLEKSVALQREVGLPTRLLQPTEIRGIVPELDPAGVHLASFHADDGVVFPWPFVWGYARGAQALGVHVATYRDVVGFETRGDTITGVRMRTVRHGDLADHERLAPTHAGGARTPSLLERRPPVDGEIETVSCDRVVLCAGAWSPEISATVGLALPNKPHRHEICATEPLKPWLGPLVATLDDGLYFSQSGRGEIVGGIGVDPVPEGVNQRSSAAFLARYAKAMVRTAPVLANVRVLRQWAGCYDLTPDSQPIVGPVDAPKNLVLACGFMGHGFMMAPIVAEMLADHLATGAMPAEFESWSLARFRSGSVARETMIIG